MRELISLGVAALVAGGVAFCFNVQPPIICCTFIAAFMGSGYLLFRFWRR